MNCPQCDADLTSEGGSLTCPTHGEFKSSEEPSSDPAAVASSGGNNVFLSYGRGDAMDFAKRLAEDLKKAGNHEVFLDLTDISTGGLFEVHIERGIRNSSVMLAIMSPQSLREESVCRDEVVFALNQKKEVVPIQLDDSVRPSLLLARRNWIDFSGDYDTALRKLLDFLAGNEKSLLKPLLHNIGGMEPIDFGVEIASNAQNFFGREWLLGEIDAWLHGPESKPFLIVAEPGMGKSAIVAWLSLQRADSVLATHFCTQQNTRSKDPMEFVANLVGLLHARLPGFQEEVSSRHPEKRRESASDMFRELIVDPCVILDNKEPRPQPMMILIDSLDEAELTEGETISDVIRNQAASLPSWLRLLLTSRPDEKAMSKLRGLGIHKIPADRKENLEDLRNFVRARLERMPEKLVAEEMGDYILDRIADLANGNFLYARLVLDALQDGSLEVDDLGHLAPELGSFYMHGFAKRFPDADLFEQETATVLCPLAVAESPLSFSDLKSISGLPGNKVNRLLQQLKFFLRTVGTGKHATYALFHRSLQDWLLDQEEAGDYFCDEEPGHKALADFGWTLYLSGELDSHPYLQVHLPDHLLACDANDRLLTFLTDLRQLDLAMDRGDGHLWMRFLCILSDQLDPAVEFRKALDHTRLEGADLKTIGRFANKVAHLLNEYGLFQPAEVFALEATHCAEQEVGPNHPWLGECLRDLGEIRRGLGKGVLARENLEQAFQIAEREYGKDSSQVARLCNDFAVLYREAKHYEEAMEFNRKAARILENVSTPDDSALGDCYNDFVVISEAMGKDVKRLDWYQKALDLFRLAHGEEHPLIAIALANIGNVYMTRKEFKVADRYFRRALDMLLRFCVSSHPNCQGIRSLLSSCRIRQGNILASLKMEEEIAASVPQGTEEALVKRFEVVRLREGVGMSRDLARSLKEIGEEAADLEDAPEVQRILLVYAQALNSTALRLKNSLGNYSEAERLYRAAIAANPKSPHYVGNLAQLLATVGDRFSEAAVLFQHGLELDPTEQTLNSNYALMVQNLDRNYELAEEHYQLALADEPDDPWFRGNYATLLLARGDVAQAKKITTETWGTFHDRRNRALLRHLYVRALIAALEGGKETLFLQQLKTHLCSTISHAPWPVTALLEELAPQLGNNTTAFFRAVSAAIDSKDAVVGLDAFPLWVSLEEVGLEAGWPTPETEQ